MGPANLIDGRWHPLQAEGADVTSVNPARPEEVVWSARASIDAVSAAIVAARRALPAWRMAGADARAGALKRFAAVVTARTEDIARAITREMGKTLAESRLEVKLLADKVAITLGETCQSRVRPWQVAVAPTRVDRCSFRSHGVMAVLGPFNFPAHLPNGHWVPALLLGNTIVFKPSERTPLVGQIMAECMVAAELPPGVFNLVQGGPEVAKSLVAHDGLDGILFTGSWPVGRSIMQANLDRPGRLLALEMGGSNAAIVLDDAHRRQAVLECARASFATTGQRCTCTRRIVVHESAAPWFIPAFCRMASTLLVGEGDGAAPAFMGPLTTEAARRAALEFQAGAVSRGATILLRASALDRPGWFMTPGILKWPRLTLEHDGEVFAPIVQLAVARNDEDALEQANASRFGLAASVFTASRARWEALCPRLEAGCVNWNVGTAGASSALPFGGLGLSGNHRPAAAFSVDSCAAPIAHLEESSDAAAVPDGALWDDTWLG
ncbi:MAG: aldehyde dehydrogenase family protein [Planctomycetes bacterium]|nr:aldehyde dehydrogenase family protein [Planctomycetota bacterium]